MTATPGEALRQARTARAWSQDRLARAYNECAPAGSAPIGREDVSRWEGDRRRMTPHTSAIMARALGVEAEQLTAVLPDPIRVAHEWLLADQPQTLASEAGRRVGAELAATLEARVVELRILDDYLGGRDLAPLLGKELRASVRLVRESAYSQETGRRLLTVVGELSQLAGWSASDAGHYRAAQTHYLAGVQAATEAGQDGLAGNLLSCLAYQMTNRGQQLPDAQLLARTAAKGAAAATPMVRALLLERVAWAAASAGNAEQTARVLDQVDETFDSRRPGDDDPHWVYWLSRDEVDTMRARCAIRLGDPAAAEQLLVPVLARYPADAARECALYWSWLAEAYARAHQTDQAREALGRVLGYAQISGSQRVDDRIAAVEGLLGAA